MAVEWLDRSLVVGPFLCLALDEVAYQKAMDDLNVPKDDRSPFLLTTHCSATVHFCENPENDLCAIVCIKTDGRTGIEIAGLLLHEAVHIWQRFRRRIGETSPSDEFEAYAIQRLAQQLMWSFQEQKSGKVATGG